MTLLSGSSAGKSFGLASTLLIASVLNVVNASTEALPETAAQVRVCQAIEKNELRLVCYDDLFAQKDVKTVDALLPSNTQEKTALVGVVSTNSQAPNNVPAVQAKIDMEEAKANFGAERLERNQTQNPISELSASVISLKEDARGRRTFTLENGQAWKEGESSRLRITEGTQVVIKKGVFSAYYLKRDDSNRTVRVSRVK